jgi:peptidoglycan-associated lipoprotein
LKYNNLEEITMNNPMRVILMGVLAVSMAACTKKQEVKPVDQADPVDTTTTTTASTDDGKFGPEDLNTDSCLRQRVVYFDFDQSEIKGEAAAILACHGKYLTDQPGAKMTLEGHADERGSREYNIGLGERRGNAVSSALQANGGSASQITVNSYGEERPTCSESDESCWGKNRRVEIVYTQSN